MKTNLKSWTYALASAVFLTGQASAALLVSSSFTGTDNTARTVVSSVSGGLSGTMSVSYAVTIQGTPQSAGDLFISASTGNTINNFNPRKNVDSGPGEGWQSAFDYNGGTQTISLTDVSFNVYRFSNAGTMSGTIDSSVRSVNISAEYTLNGGTTWFPIGSTVNVNLTPSLNVDGVAGTIPLNFILGSPVTVNLATDDFRVRYGVINDDTSVGANNAIASMQINGSVVPEPSGISLAGLALAGTVLRRRRR